MGFVRYRDPATGRFVSRRSASHRTAHPVTTESYSKRNKRTGETSGYFRGIPAIQKSLLFGPAEDLGIPRDFIQAAILAEPDITFEELVELAGDLGVEFDADQFEMVWLEELDVDKELYKET